MKVFISYAREDRKTALKLYQDLKKAGLDPWLDQKNLLPSQNWQRHIELAIKSSDFFIALLSNNSVNKKGYVQKELKKALDILDETPYDEGFIIPIRLDECEPENEKIKNLHWAELSDDYAHCLDLVISGMKAQYAQENNKVRIRSVETKKTSASTKTESITQMEFQWIEGGYFMMGQTEVEKKQIIDAYGKDIYDRYKLSNELPRHEVCVNGFWMAKYPVTVGQFRQFVQATGHQTDAEKAGESYTLKDKQWQTVKGVNWKNPGFEQDENHPAVCLSWNDGVALAKWLSEKNEGTIRLPTEAEWEYASRAGTTTARFWGDDPSQACQYANVADQTAKKEINFTYTHDCDDGYVFTSPVGTFLPNPWGLYDMLGNVLEWTADAYDEKAYEKHKRDNPIMESGGASFRVLRGGSWFNDPASVRCASRDGLRPDVSLSNTGQRLLWTVNF
jgi:formylglycine-generating enzyme required for sulfatase activity